MIIAIDPGSVRTGVAVFDYDPTRKKANVKVMRILDSNDVDGMLQILSKHWSKHTIVLEMFRHAYSTGNFRGRKTANVTQDELNTIRLCKRVKAVAASKGYDLITQEPSILAMGRKWYPLPLPKGHISDEHAACIHGMKYMMDYGLITSPKDVTFYSQEQLPLDVEERANETGMM